MIPKFRAYWVNEKRWFRDDIIITDDGHMWNIVNGELYDIFDRDIEEGLLSLMQSTGLTDGVGGIYSRETSLKQQTQGLMNHMEKEY